MPYCKMVRWCIATHSNSKYPTMNLRRYILPVLLLSVSFVYAQDDLYFNPDTDLPPVADFDTDYDDDDAVPNYADVDYDDDEPVEYEGSEWVDEDLDYAEERDFQYSSRIRRFHRNQMGFAYYDPFFADPFFYDPFFQPGMSIYFGGNSYIDFVRWRRWQRFNTFYNPFFNPFYNPYAFGPGMYAGVGFNPYFNSFYNPYFNNYYCPPGAGLGFRNDAGLVGVGSAAPSNTVFSPRRRTGGIAAPGGTTVRTGKQGRARTTSAATLSDARGVSRAGSSRGNTATLQDNDRGTRATESRRSSRRGDRVSPSRSRRSSPSATPSRSRRSSPSATPSRSRRSTPSTSPSRSRRSSPSATPSRSPRSSSTRSSSGSSRSRGSSRRPN